jgi:transcriptional regulator GlxA family with amidase domain
VTTHHEVLAELRLVAPRARVIADRVFVMDGPIATCAGAAAGLDLALALVAESCGAEVAARVAVTLNVYFRRGPDDPEQSPLLRHRNHLSALVHRVQDAVSAEPRRRWTSDSLAAVAGTSARNLDRLFTEHAGVLPRRFVAEVRVERARVDLDHGVSVSQAASHAGFTSDQQLRRAWREVLGGSPSGR